jgi:hypothetical protein
MPDAPSSARVCAPSVLAAVTAVRRLDQHPRAVARRESPRVRIASHYQDAGEALARRQRAQHVLEHRAEQRPALALAEHARQTLLGVLQILDRHHRPQA